MRAAKKEIKVLHGQVEEKNRLPLIGLKDTHAKAAGAAEK